MNGDLGLGIVVSMKDAFSQNAQRIRGSMMDLDSTVADASERMTRNLDRIQQGTMMLGAGLALMAVPAALVASTAATQKALGELASLGVRICGPSKMPPNPSPTNGPVPIRPLSSPPPMT